MPRKKIPTFDADDPAIVRRLFAAVPDGLWLVDNSGRTLWVNDRMAALFGIAPKKMIGLEVADLHDAVGRDQYRAALAHANETGTGVENAESRFLLPDGSVLWGLVSSEPFLDEDGTRVGWLYRVTPNPEHRLLETLTEREHQLATAQAIAHLGSWDWDAVADRVEWSDELCRIVGVPPGTLRDFSGYLDVVHPDDLELCTTTIAAAMETGSEYGYEHRIIRADGEHRWVSVRGQVQLTPEGAPAGISGTVQDITALKRADALAAEANRRLRLLQQMATSANAATTLREAVLLAGAALPENTTWVGVAAYFYDDAGTCLEVIPISGPAVDPTTLPDADPELAERARRVAEPVVGRPSLSPEDHSLVAMPVLVEGDVVCVIEMYADEVPPDEDAYSLLDQIARRFSVVGERDRAAAELAQARDHAMEASRLKSEFLATMSHEIRTPMNGVIGLTDLLLRTPLDEQQQRLARNLQTAGLNLLAIINDILDLSKIEAGRLELESADFDVRELFDQIAALLSGPAHEKGLELVVACQPDVPVQLRGDQVRLGQIVANLGSNAIKFTDHGEVVIEARVERRTAHDVVLRVDVTDTGMGIAPDQRDRLFEAFTQADPSTTRRHGGTGLGLAISRQLVEAFGGEIWVVSDPGRGSTFSFTARLEPVAGGRVHPGLPPQLEGRRVLVVDDNDTNRLILEEQLSAWGLRPVGVGTAAEALATLREAIRSEHPFDAALLDLVMPDVDGLELASRIRTDPALREIALLLLSSDQSVTLQQIADAGIHHSLSKPVRSTELHDVLSGLLGAAVEVPLPADQPSHDLGVRVLVVEDNQVNQLVATGLLEAIGCVADVATDGLEAVDRLAGDHPYDLVLMDCRMPHLDGFDATRRIRDSEPRGRRVPIIAMTASALEGERERCLAAGMDDYLSKPVDPAELERAVDLWAPAAGLPAPAEAAATATDEGRLPADVLDHDRIAMLDDLVKDGSSFFQRTAASFVGRIGDQMTAICQAIDDGSPHQLLTSAHQVKGSALNLGLPRVAAAAARLEDLGIAGHTDDTESLLDDLVTEIDLAIAALQQATGPRA